jgi:hypothetical protein
LVVQSVHIIQRISGVVAGVVELCAAIVVAEAVITIERSFAPASLFAPAVLVWIVVVIVDDRLFDWAIASEASTTEPTSTKTASAVAEAMEN